MPVTVTMKNHWHYRLTESDLKKGVKRLREVHPEKAKVFGGNGFPHSLGVVWVLKDDRFSELLVIDDVCFLNAHLPCLKSKGGYLLIVPQNTSDFSGINRVSIQVQGKEQILVEGKPIPLEFSAGPQEIALDVGFLTSTTEKKALYDPLCCTACWLTHDSLHLHCLDCICCAGTCGYHCHRC